MRRATDLLTRNILSLNAIHISGRSSSVYYRVYSTDGAIQLKHPVSCNDRYLGCIAAELAAPPHTAVSIMQCISTSEDLVYSKPSQLFLSVSCGSPIRKECVARLTSDCPGSTPQDPMVFLYSKYTKQLLVTYPWSESTFTS